MKKAHARKVKRFVEFNAKDSNIAENSKFTFYCQNQFFALYQRRNDVPHQAAQQKYE